MQEGIQYVMPRKLMFMLCLFALALSCATYKATLTNSKGQTMTCEASGKGCGVKSSFDECVAAAKSAGYSETPPPAKPDGG